ncbi:MAG: nucleoside monophosphate kinase [Armatimonadota bacterium]
MKRVVFLGPPGAGKGTQGIRLASFWAVPHIASGVLLRRLLQQEPASELSLAVRVIERGNLVSDETVADVVFRELDTPAARTGFVLDGYPRSAKQARDLEAHLAADGRELDAVIGLTIAEDVLVARLSGRLTCNNCGSSYHIVNDPPRQKGICDRCASNLVVRDDDKPGPIRTRLALYKERAEPLLAYYRERNLLREVDAEGTEEDVFHRILLATGSSKKSLIY